MTLAFALLLNGARPIAVGDTTHADEELTPAQRHRIHVEMNVRACHGMLFGQRAALKRTRNAGRAWLWCCMIADTEIRLAMAEFTLKGLPQ